ncbi:MAG: ABC transporter ATP-binding protein, partial [Candidatus Hodarchaeota archaeon]
MIILEEVTKSFGDVVAVSRLSAHIKENSITGFLGPNGAGKSTTQKLIMGEIKPSLGKVEFMGENPWNNSAVKRNIGYVSEDEDLYLWMTSTQFVSSMARLCMPREAAIKATKEALRLVKLNTTKKIGAFSKGMKQRVKLAGAIVHSPKLLLLDEPFGGIDPVGRKEMKNLIVDLRNDHGVTVLVSSHILHEIDEISTHMLLIHRGQTIAQGRTTDIVELIDKYPHTITIKSE